MQKIQNQRYWPPSTYKSKRKKKRAVDNPAELHKTPVAMEATMKSAEEIDIVPQGAQKRRDSRKGNAKKLSNWISSPPLHKKHGRHLKPKYFYAISRKTRPNPNLEFTFPRPHSFQKHSPLPVKTRKKWKTPELSRQGPGRLHRTDMTLKKHSKRTIRNGFMFCWGSGAQIWFPI